ncbi:MAG: TonB-dependent receptor [Nannocystaceae bacterium]
MAVAASVTVVHEAKADITNSVIIGVVRDAKTGDGIEGAVVIITGEKIQGERVMTTDVSGLYRIANLPVGEYDITILHKDYGEGKQRKGLKLRGGTTIRVDISLMPAGGDKRTIEVPAPTVDVGSSSTGLSVDKEMARRVPIAAPTGKGGANRSFEAIAEATPTAANDTYGTSVAGTTSPENKYQIDGLSVNDPGFGLNGTPLTVEFLEQVSVESGGYMPEYGRATGGIVNATTKSGSNEFHGGVWGYFTPGALEGQRKYPVRDGSTLQTQNTLGWLGDAGFDIGGRIIKDKLWFYGGVQVSRSVYKLNTSWNRTIVDDDGMPVTDPDTTYRLTERIPGSTVLRKAQGTSVQALGKLTYAPAKNHTLELLGIFAPSVSGGNGTYGINARTGNPETTSLQGDYNALAHRYNDTATDVQLKWLANSDDQKWNFDTTIGWHHQVNQRMAADGSSLGSGSGLSNVPGVIYRRSNPNHALTDFAELPPGAMAGACDPWMAPGQLVDATTICPAQTWSTGGPGFLWDRKLDRLQARSMFTRLARGAGHHLIKGGIDFEYMGYNSARGYSGGTLYRESTSGSYFQDYRQYGYLTGPDEAIVLDALRWNVHSTTIGGFVQDSWAIMDKVTLNAGVRYDAQYLFSGDGAMAMALPNQVAPRVGLIWDPTQSGKSKIAINYARYFQSIPLNLADRAGSGEPGSISFHDAGACMDPSDVDMHTGVCADNSTRLPLYAGDTTPDYYWYHYGAAKTAIDPNLKPQTSDDIVALAEYEIFPNGRLGVQYTHRWLTRVIEDMSRDEATTYFIGNPGYGIAKDFPKATRVYDAAVFFLEKRFTDHWLLTGSYTLSWLRGNIAGLFRPETGQLDPGINSDFDLISLLDNRTGYLAGDTRHVLKVFSAGEIVVDNKNAILLGGAVRARSGQPVNALGSHPLYGSGEAFLVERGTYGRTPWTFGIDTNVGYSHRFSKDVILSLTMDIFNVANFQEVIAVDQNYTYGDVVPIKGATADQIEAMYPDVEKNPNFGNPIAYQRPRMFRFGVRLTF